jgi:hypothetical protein
VNLAILGFVYCSTLGKSMGFIAWQNSNLLQHYNTCKVTTHVSLFFVFRFQVSMVEKKCYVGGVHENTNILNPKSQHVRC